MCLKKCYICGQPTDFSCADCTIEFQVKIFVCGNKECRDRHKNVCSFQIRKRMEELEKVVN
jgi:hypothetical protein